MRVLLASGAFVAPEPLDAWHFAWDGRTYRGTSGATMLPDGRPALINTLPLDAYLYGVLGREIAASWAPAAQQAQAIASRTYALGKLRPGKPYDVVATEGDQRYDGIEAETVEGRAAIDATAARIVTFAGAPAHVAYSSCCGGRTADAGDVWKTPYPYLVSVADPNCLATPDFTWSAQIGRDDLERALGARLAGIGTLRDVRVRTPGPGARPTAVTFAGSGGAFDVSPAELRAALGPRVVRSTFVRSAALGGVRSAAPATGAATIELAGTGRGHGVGMCQWGARTMGERGSTAAEIVAFYFPGTALGRA